MYIFLSYTACMNTPFKNVVVLLFVALIGLTSISVASTAMMISCDSVDSNLKVSKFDTEEHLDLPHESRSKTENQRIKDCFTHCGDSSDCSMGSCSVYGSLLTQNLFSTHINSRFNSHTIENSSVLSVYLASPYRPPQA